MIKLHDYLTLLTSTARKTVNSSILDLSSHLELWRVTAAYMVTRWAHLIQFKCTRYPWIVIFRCVRYIIMTFSLHVSPRDNNNDLISILRWQIQWIYSNFKFKNYYRIIHYITLNFIQIKIVIKIKLITISMTLP